jgi:hypothetical protein
VAHRGSPRAAKGGGPREDGMEPRLMRGRNNNPSLRARHREAIHPLAWGPGLQLPGAADGVDIGFETDDPNLFRTAHLRLDPEEWLGYPVDIVRLCSTMNASMRERTLREARNV